MDKNGEYCGTMGKAAVNQFFWGDGESNLGAFGHINNMDLWVESSGIGGSPFSDGKNMLSHLWAMEHN